MNISGLLEIVVYLLHDKNEVVTKIYSQMILNRGEIKMIDIEQVLSSRETAKLALEFAVKKSNTKEELLQCAKYAE